MSRNNSIFLLLTGILFSPFLLIPGGALFVGSKTGFYHIDLLVVSIIVYIGLIYGKKQGVYSGLVIVLFAFFFYVPGDINKFFIKIDSYIIRLMSYLFLGYLAGVVKELMEGHIARLNRADYEKASQNHSVNLWIFIPLMLVVSFRFKSNNGVIIESSDLYYIAPLLIAFRCGMTKAVKWMLYFSFLFIFSAKTKTFGLSYSGYNVAQGEIVLLLLSIYLLGNLKRDPDELNWKVILYFSLATLLFISLNVNYKVLDGSGYNYSKSLYYSGSDFTLALIYLSGYILGSYRGFQLALIWGIANSITYQHGNFFWGAHDYYIMAAPLIGYLGGVYKYRENGILPTGIIIIIAFNLLYLFLGYLLTGFSYNNLIAISSASSWVFMPEPYQMRLVAVIQGITCLLVFYPVAFSIRKKFMEPNKPILNNVYSVPVPKITIIFIFATMFIFSPWVIRNLIDKEIIKDSDKDGIANFFDECTDTPINVRVQTNGCSLDRDGDGVHDSIDMCPNTLPGVGVVFNGCPPDVDNDGVADYTDHCPNSTEFELSQGVDINGCPRDSDSDGIPDYRDRCPVTRADAIHKIEKDGCIPVLTKNAEKTEPRYHIVQRGEGLYAISGLYGHNFRDVAAWNNISPPYALVAGQRLLITAPQVADTLYSVFLGRYVDKTDQLEIQRAIMTSPTNEPVSWHNPNSGNQYQVTPVNHPQHLANGATCRKYSATVIIDGKTETVYGTACRQPDGTWKVR